MMTKLPLGTAVRCPQLSTSSQVGSSSSYRALSGQYRTGAAGACGSDTTLSPAGTEAALAFAGTEACARAGSGSAGGDGLECAAGADGTSGCGVRRTVLAFAEGVRLAGGTADAGGTARDGRPAGPGEISTACAAGAVTPGPPSTLSVRMAAAVSIFVRMRAPGRFTFGQLAGRGMGEQG